MVVCPAGHASAADDFCDVCGLLIGPVSQARPAPDPWGPGAPAGAPPSGGGPGRTGQGGDPARPAGNACPNCGTPRVGSFTFCDVCGLNFNTGLMPDGRPPGGQGDLPGPGPSGPTRRDPVVAPKSWFDPGVPAAPPERRSEYAPAAPTIRPESSSSQAPSQASVPVAPSPRSAGSEVWSAVVSADRGYYDHVREENGPDAEGIVFPAYCAERRFALAGPEMRIGRHSASRGIYPEIDLTGPPTDPGISRLHAVLIARPSGEWAVLDPGSANGTLLNGTEIPVGEEVPLRDGDRLNLGAWTAVTVQRG